MPRVATKTQKNKEAKEVIKKQLGRKKVVNASEPVTTTPLKGVLKEGDFGKAFNEPANPSLLSQYIRVYRFNQRSGNAQTKTRGDVSGSGKKPWKQKGTGRSRVGSIRTPVWRHGGVSHGPVSKDWSLRLPVKMRAAAFRVVLSQKILESRVFYVDKIDLMEGRTREVLGLLESWGKEGSMLIVTEKINSNLLAGSSNLRNVEVVNCDNLNTYQLMAHRNVVFEKGALDEIKGKYAKNK